MIECNCNPIFRSRQSSEERVAGSHPYGQAEACPLLDRAQGFTHQIFHWTDNFLHGITTVTLHFHNNGIDTNNNMRPRPTLFPRDGNTGNTSTSPLVSGWSSLEQDEQCVGPSYLIVTQPKETLESCGPPLVLQYAPFYIEWHWELITWSLGTCAIAVIVLLLCQFKDKPSVRWNSKVQLSAIVAALSQVAQSALVVSDPACIGQSN